MWRSEDAAKCACMYIELQRKSIWGGEPLGAINILWETAIHCHEVSSKIFFSAALDTSGSWCINIAFHKFFTQKQCYWTKTLTSRVCNNCKCSSNQSNFVNRH